jgi:hypothetical protein
VIKPFVFDFTVTLPFLLTGLALLFTWWRTRDAGVDNLFKAGAERMTSLDRRLAVLEMTIQSLPARQDFHQLDLGMSEMRGDMRALMAKLEGQSEIMKRIEAMVSRHEEHLMDDRK